MCLLGPSVVATIDCGPQVLQMYHRQGACPIGVRPRGAPNWCQKIQFETPICSIGVRRQRFHAEISGMASPSPADRRQRRPRPRASSWPLWAHRPSSIVQRITFLPAGWVQATIARVVWGWSLASLTRPLNRPPCAAPRAGSGRVSGRRSSAASFFTKQALGKNVGRAYAGGHDPGCRRSVTAARATRAPAQDRGRARRGQPPARPDRRRRPSVSHQGL